LRNEERSAPSRCRLRIKPEPIGVDRARRSTAPQALVGRLWVILRRPTPYRGGRFTTANRQYAGSLVSRRPKQAVQSFVANPQFLARICYNGGCPMQQSRRAAAIMSVCVRRRLRPRHRGADIAEISPCKDHDLGYAKGNFMIELTSPLI